MIRLIKFIYKLICIIFKIFIILPFAIYKFSKTYNHEELENEINKIIKE